MYLLLGYGISNKSISRYFDLKNIDYQVYDDKNPFIIDYSKYEKVVKSPGYPENEILKHFKEKQVPIVTDLELYGEFKKETDRITVTGTNGKSTTVSIIKNILNNRVELCGNIGIPLFDVIDSKKSSLIEASSFMLAYVNKYESKYNIILNLKSNHIEHHKTFNNYIASKLKLIKNLKNNDFLIYNYDDELLRKLVDKIVCYKIPFSIQKEVKGGYLENDYLYFNKRKIIKTSDIPLEGKHNIENVLASICLAYCYGVTIEEIRSGIMSYKNLEHRIEFVKRINNIDVYNDSKSTNFYALSKALEAISPIYKNIGLICGGKLKDDNINILNNKIDKIKIAYIYGENKDVFIQFFKDNNLSYEVYSNLHEFVKTAKITNEIDVLLFSPGSQSYDEFRNFEDRGCFFKENMIY